MCSLITCAKCCTFYSISGFIFLISIGILLDKQPLYIHGVTDSASSAQGCFVGAAIYIITMFSSIAYWLYYNRIQEKTLSFGNMARNEGMPLAGSRPTAKYGTLGSSKS